MSDSVDRISIPTRNNLTPSAPYAANFSNQNQVTDPDIVENFNNNQQNDYLNNSQTSYHSRASEYFNDQLQPLDSFNSVSSGYANAY